jgi:N-methylhydantoinase A
MIKLDGGARDAIAATLDELEQRAREELRQLELGTGVAISRSAYMRFTGQGYDIRVALPAGPIDDDYEQKMRAAFFETYKREYGFVDPDAAVETTDWYVVASLPNVRGAGAIRSDAVTGLPESAITGEREAYFPELGGMVASQVVDRYRMRADDEIAGPCLVEERESTTVILPGDVARVDHLGHLVIEIDARRRNVQ